MCPEHDTNAGADAGADTHPPCTRRALQSGQGCAPPGGSFCWRPRWPARGDSPRASACSPAGWALPSARVVGRWAWLCTGAAAGQSWVHFSLAYLIQCVPHRAYACLYVHCTWTGYRVANGVIGWWCVWRPSGSLGARVGCWLVVGGWWVVRNAAWAWAPFYEQLCKLIYNPMTWLGELTTSAQSPKSVCLGSGPAIWVAFHLSKSLKKISDKLS